MTKTRSPACRRLWSTVTGRTRRVRQDVGDESREGGYVTKAATPATTALNRAGITFTVHRFQHDPAATSYGLEAAQAIGVTGRAGLQDPAGRRRRQARRRGRAGGRVARPEGTGHAPRGGKRAGMAASAAAERATGYVVGGISPLGQRGACRRWSTRARSSFATVYVSAGRRGFDVGLAPADLIRLTRRPRRGSVATADVAAVGSAHGAIAVSPVTTAAGPVPRRKILGERDDDEGHDDRHDRPGQHHPGGR